MEDDSKVIEQKRQLHDKQYKEEVRRRRLMGRYRKCKPEGPRKPEIAEGKDKLEKYRFSGSIH